VAEPADIRVDGKPFFRNVANGESLSLVVPAKSYSLDVVATATGSRTILPAVRAALAPGTLTRVFAFGNPDEKTSDAIVQVIKVSVVGAAEPRFVHTGDGGQAADELVGADQLPWTAAAVGMGLLGLAGLAGAAGGSLRSLQVTGGRPRR
jgi:ABC-type transport system involved in cytochrome c biogenesis permease subunit